MSKWRPAKKVQVKVIGLCIGNGALLAMEVLADDGSLKGVRPLGGLIEFGETRDAAIKREFMEELDTQIKCVGHWRTFENLYVHEGQQGHEIIFAIDIELLDKSLYDREVIVFSEDSGSDCTARWFSIEDLKNECYALYPDGLLDTL